MPKGPLDQVFNLTAPMYFKSSPRRVPFANDAPPMPYGGMMLPGEQYDQQSKSRAEMSSTHANTTSCTNNGHVSDAMLVKTEAAGSSNCTKLKDPYVSHGSDNSSMPPATVSAPPLMPQAQSIPSMGQYSNPVFQGLLDPKAQYHKSLAEYSRMEREQRKQQEEANKQQQLYIQLLQQYSNQLPESTRPQAEMLQTLLTDPNMVNMLQHIFKGQEQPPPQEQQTSPPVVTSVSPVQRTPPLSAPPSYSPGPSSSSAMNQTVFQYHAINGNKEYTQVSPETFSVEVSTMSM